MLFKPIYRSPVLFHCFVWFSLRGKPPENVQKTRLHLFLGVLFGQEQGRVVPGPLQILRRVDFVPSAEAHGHMDGHPLVSHVLQEVAQAGPSQAPVVKSSNKSTICFQTYLKKGKEWKRNSLDRTDRSHLWCSFETVDSVYKACLVSRHQKDTIKSSQSKNSPVDRLQPPGQAPVCRLTSAGSIFLSVRRNPTARYGGVNQDSDPSKKNFPTFNFRKNKISMLF